VVLKDPRNANGELIANDQGIVSSRAATQEFARRQPRER